VSILILEEPLKGEGKGHTITGHEGLEGGYNSILSLTLAVDGVGGQRHAPAALPPGKTGVTCAVGWVEPQSSPDGYGKSRPPSGIDPRTLQPVASRYTDWAYRGPPKNLAPPPPRVRITMFSRHFTLRPLY
jgi:hypothetical protein